MSDDNKEPLPIGNAPTDDLAEKVESLLRKHDGKPDEVVRTLLKDNFDLREKRRNDRAEFERQLNEVKGKVPGDDVVTLSKDVAAQVERLKELGGLDAVKERLDRYQELEQKVQKRERSDNLRSIASKAQFDPDVFEQLCNLDGLDPDLFEVKNIGSEKNPSYQVRAKDGDDKDLPIQKFVEKRWAKFLPSLRAADAAKTKPVFRGSLEADHSDRLHREIKKNLVF